MKVIAWVVAVGTATACRPQGLPEPPSGMDAADPDAPAPAARKRQPLERSAFEGVELDAGGHKGHGGRHRQGESRAPQPTPAAPATHSGHGERS